MSLSTKTTPRTTPGIGSQAGRSLFQFVVAALATATLTSLNPALYAQDAAAAPTAQTAPAADAAPAAADSQPAADSKTSKKDEKVVLSKDSRKLLKRDKKDKINQLAGIDAKLPDKALYDKAEDAVKHGHFDVARLDLQTLLNTYPDSQFQMRAKLAIADSWYKEGGSAALTQAEQEYKDFITFFPNAPEAAEAQMRVGDIYFKQMDKPDRDYTKTKQAEQEYRLMMQQFPDSPLVPQAKQRLREVQETLANRETGIADFYAGHGNMAASIARYQTVVDTYPLYSRMDEVLIGLGDAYEAQAKLVRGWRMKEDVKAQLEKVYDDQASAAYRKVVLEHSAAPHVEDARDRLAAMNLPIPTPSPEQAAASAALENSRGQYTLSKRATMLVMHQANTVPAASIGEPPLEDAKPTLAPTIVNNAAAAYQAAINPGSAPRSGTPLPATGAGEAAPDAQTPQPAAPVSFQDVPAPGSAAAAPAVGAVQPGTTAAPAGGGTSMGIEIVPSSGAGSGGSTSRPANGAPPAFPSDTQATPATGAPATPATQATPAGQSGLTNPLAPVGPPNTTALAPIQKPDAAPDTVNEAKPGTQTAQTAPANGKKQKPAFYKDTESSNKHKKKKGAGKLNPF